MLGSMGERLREERWDPTIDQVPQVRLRQARSLILLPSEKCIERKTTFSIIQTVNKSTLGHSGHGSLREIHECLTPCVCVSVPEVRSHEGLLVHLVKKK